MVVMFVIVNLLTGRKYLCCHYCKEFSVFLSMSENSKAYFVGVCSGSITVTFQWTNRGLSNIPAVFTIPGSGTS